MISPAISISICLFLCSKLSSTFYSPIKLNSQPHRERFAKEDASLESDKPKMTIGKLAQLMAMGAGAPMLGEFKEIDENGKMIFELEANNLVDSEGNSIQAKAKYFTDGYVEEKNELSPPGFWGNLMSGGKLQGEWEAKIRASKETKE